MSVFGLVVCLLIPAAMLLENNKRTRQAGAKSENSNADDVSGMQYSTCSFPAFSIPAVLVDN